MSERARQPGTPQSVDAGGRGEMSGAEGPVTVAVNSAQPYRVVIGAGLLDDLVAAVKAVGNPRRVALVHAPTLTATAEVVREALQEAGLATHMLEVPDAEDAKTLDVLGYCWDVFGQIGIDRSDVVIGLGGGSVTDLAGFAAATWMRGVAVVQVPTTLLAMVDAAIGGKTGINTGSGKNMVGAFYEPAAVIADLAFLETLPRNELVAGMAEVIKSGFIADPVILDLVEATDPAELTAESPVLRELVERAIRVKAGVVAADLKETGGADGHPGREALNYGHTLAHAIERFEHYRIRHGEAVAIGCVYVAELAGRAGLIDADLVERHRTAFARVGLPTSYAAAPFEDLLAGMRVDKKARGSQLRFLVLRGLADPTILTGPDEADLRASYAAIGGPA